MLERMRRHRATSRGAWPRDGAAFTILELLVVITIIAILVSIMLPSLKKAMLDANSAVCMHNLKEIGQALHIYRIENDGWLPDVNVRRDRADTWFVKLYPRIMTDLNLLACPEDPFRYRWERVEGKTLREETADYSSYGLSSFILTAAKGRLANIDRYTPWRPLDTLLLADIGPDNKFRSPSQPRNLVEPDRNASLLYWDDGVEPYDPLKQAPWLTTRHYDGINVMTVGFAVRSVKTIDMQPKDIRSYYPQCAAGGCTLCSELRTPHFSFSSQGLYWWTGPLPRKK